jgi:hypothetical protein
MSSVTWACPNCKRRVPNRVTTCHCGTTRAQADQLEASQEAAAKRPAPKAWTPRPRPIRRTPLGRDVKLLLVGLVVIALLAVVRMFMPWQPEGVHPVLGFRDVGRPTLPPKPTPEPVGTPRPHTDLPPSQVR